MKFRQLYGLIGFVCLLSCQEVQEGKEEAFPKEYNRLEAASINIQLGLAYLKKGNRPLAKKKLLMALSQAPNSPAANTAMAYFMEKSEEWDEATRYYKKAMALAPGGGDQLNNYGVFLCRRGDYQQAERYFLQAVQDRKYEHSAAAYENAGLCAMAIPDNTKAERYFKKALSQDPSRSQSLYELVNLEKQQAHYERALDYLKQYPALTLHSATLLKSASELSHQLGEVELEAKYKLQFLREFAEKTGVRDEYNSHNTG